jgi:tRNA threonylcarbamoyladenosine biosynthesis protein TsaE
MEKIFISENEAQTIELAQKLAKITKTGDVWALNGTLGMGKTVFARAFIQALSDALEVPSPTFTLLQTYATPEFNIYHYDLYRLEKPADVFELGVEEAFYSGVSLVEWPEKMGEFLPRDVWFVSFAAEGEGRKITVATFDEEKIGRLQNVR